jgi:3'-phosphoadenosine 5'-phosphosulfate synthase
MGSCLAQVPTGWQIVVDYYQNQETKRWVPWSRQVAGPAVANNAVASGEYGSADFSVSLRGNGGQPLSPWHGLPLRPEGHGQGQGENLLFTGVIEIPMYSTAKFEVQKTLPGQFVRRAARFPPFSRLQLMSVAHVFPGNPIRQDRNDDGTPRFFAYGSPPFNYGLLPQTWEDPSVLTDGYGGDNDPLDIIEVGASSLPIGSVLTVKVRDD